MTAIATLEGVGPANAQKLAAAGITSVNDLLAKGASSQGRQEISDQTGLNSQQILSWVNQADLFRISGIGEEYADLLVAAGVDTVLELAQRKAENLHAALAQANESKKLVRQLPTLSQVSGWVDQAGQLPRLIEY